jgi:hypothetical protein
MIAYAPGRRRTARSVIRKWSLKALVALGIAAMTAGLVGAVIFAYQSRPAREVVTVAVVVPAATAMPHETVVADVEVASAYTKPAEAPQGPTTAGPVSLRLGPGDQYVLIGTLQAGALVDVVGRDETGEWLAVVFPPNSTLRAWLTADDVLGVTNREALPLEPVRLLD